MDTSASASAAASVASKPEVPVATINSVIHDIGSLPIMELMLFVTLTFLIFLFFYLQTRKDSLDLRWLILDDTSARPSINKIGQGLALVVSTWGFIYQMTHDRFSEAYLTIYMGIWAGAGLAYKLVKPAEDPKDKEPKP